MKLLAVISARGGSKGVPKKNIRLLKNKPLISWTIEAALSSKYISRTILSSDDAEIIDVAKNFGCEVPFVRDKNLALADTPSIEVVLDAINHCPSYDWVILLQPTSPFRTHNDIDMAIEKSIWSNSKSCVSVVKINQNPHWMYELTEDCRLKKIAQGPDYLRRQDVPNIYKLNGAIYLSEIERLKQTKSFVDDQTLAYEMQTSSSFDIDTEDDFLKCEQITI